MQTERLAHPLRRALPAQHRSNVLDRNVGLLDQERKIALLARLFPGFGEPLFIFAPGCGSLLGFLAVDLFDPLLQLEEVEERDYAGAGTVCRRHADAPLRSGTTAPVAAGG